MKNLTLLLLSMAFISCDPGATEIYQLDNQSDSTIYITFQVGYQSSKRDTNVSFPPHTFNRIYEQSHLGKVQDLGSDFLSYVDSLRIYKDEARQTEISKDYRSRDNWEYRADIDVRFNRTGKSFYILTLHNGDL